MWGIRAIRVGWLAAVVLAVGGGCCHNGQKAVLPEEEIQTIEWKRGADWFPDQPGHLTPSQIHGGIIG